MDGMGDGWLWAWAVGMGVFYWLPYVTCRFPLWDNCQPARVGWDVLHSGAPPEHPKRLGHAHHI